MRNLHESVHLSNNAVQCRYQNCERDSALPEENMWDCYTFQTYLRSIGKAEAWEQIVYPGAQFVNKLIKLLKLHKMVFYY